MENTIEFKNESCSERIAKYAEEVAKTCCETIGGLTFYKVFECTDGEDVEWDGVRVEAVLKTTLENKYIRPDPSVNRSVVNENYDSDAVQEVIENVTAACKSIVLNDVARKFGITSIEIDESNLSMDVEPIVIKFRFC